jgi:molybdenum cofactor cytidylyltransferase
MTIGCAVLAAGASRRLGSLKQLVPFRGEVLVRRAVRAACASTCDEVAVVVGCRRRDVERAVAGLGAEVVFAAHWGVGLAESVRGAAAWARERKLDALVLTACDQPLLGAEHIDALCDRHRRGAELVASSYAGTRGVPALFAASWFDAFAALEGDRGAGSILRAAANVETVPWEDGAFDVDEVEDLVRLGTLANAPAPL